MYDLKAVLTGASLIVVQALVSCTGGSDETGLPEKHHAFESAVAYADWPSGLSLRAFALHDTVRLGSPVEIVYVVRNRGVRQVYRNDSRFVHLEVRDPSGQLLTREYDVPPEVHLGGIVDVVLPDHGFLGGVLDLGCGTDGYAAGVPKAAQCDWRYSLSTPGPYKVVLQYRPVPAPNRPTVDARRFQHLQADTVEFTLIP